MKYLVVLALASLACGVPIEKDYELPLAPVSVVTIPQATPVVEPAFVRAPIAPFAPTPLRFLNPAPLPIARFAQPQFVPQVLPQAVPQVVRALPTPVAAPIAPVAAPVVTPLAAALPAPVAPIVPTSQFHAQDEAGGFSFGYNNGNSAKQEVRTPDGVTRGAYSYVDANGILQEVQYVSDPVNGFRVAGTNLPVFSAEGPIAPIVPAVTGPAPVAETPEVIAARAEFQRAFEAAVARNAEAPVLVSADAPKATLALRRKREALINDYELPAAPVVVVPATPTPVPVPAPTVQTVGFIRSHHVTPLAVPAPIPAPLLPAPLRFAHAPLPQAVPAPLPLAQPVPIPAPQFLPQVVRQALPAPVALPTPVAAPITPVAAPIVTPLAAAAPVVPLGSNSQFQAQDEAGGFSFGYQNDLSARQEVRTADGVTRGSYSYVDANGVLQKVNYIADPINGFQVEGTNLPVASVA